MVEVKGLVIGNGKPKICVPIIDKKEEYIYETAKKIEKLPVDIVEWRADFFEGVDNRERNIEVLRNLKHILTKPVLFTLRSIYEGGEKVSDQVDYIECIRGVAESGEADMIDVEMFYPTGTSELVSSIKNKGIIIIGSYHNFNETPLKEELIQKLVTMFAYGADIAKIAVRATSRRDIYDLLETTAKFKELYKNKTIITMSIGALGSITRILGESFGSSVTFGCLDDKESAPGQIEVKQLHQLINGIHNIQ